MYTCLSKKCTRKSVIKQCREPAAAERRSCRASEFFPIREDRDPSAAIPLPIGDGGTHLPSARRRRRHLPLQVYQEMEDANFCSESQLVPSESLQRESVDDLSQIFQDAYFPDFLCMFN
ncbi:hypothetical protein Taro_014386 [Colocasia esculenta]|uniref:Uncharacterized protein n=1 Tax=Colocasia esculenta TaxID=4460 RepID=A0A843UIN7_COLES|nr:hypothetical protein [Colocasia esculenta]